MQCKVINKYVITPIVLGKGCFGIVYRGYLKENKNQLLAVKTIPIQTISNEQLVLRQIQILLKLESPNIVKFYSPSKTKKHLYFFMEYCQQDLKSYLKQKGGKLSETEVRDILQQICNGFKIVHKKNIIHRDIKPANFLIHKGIIKISDFGFARTVDSLEQMVFLTFLGSPLYMAPQILAKEKFSSKCDIWSLGVTLYQFLYGQTPYTAPNTSQLLKKILNTPLRFPQNVHRSDEIKKLLIKMLTVEQQHRISWNQLFIHPVVCPVKLEQLVQISLNDDLLARSFANNHNYMKMNQVVHKTIKTQNNQQKQSKLNNLQVKNKNTQQINTASFEETIKKQQKQISQYLQLDQIDQWMRYRRNVSVFLNVQCNNIFTLTVDKLPSVLFYIGLYLILSYQILIHMELKKQLKLQTSSLAIKICPHTWISYLKSSAYQRICKLVDCDLLHLQSYYNEVKQRVIKTLKNTEKQNIKKFQLSFFQDKLLNSKEFNFEIYQFMMKIIIQQLEKNSKINRNFICKLKITVNPFEYLKKNLDFGLFYEFQDEQLDKLQKQYEQLKPK